MKKRFLALLIAAVMLTALFSACGGSSNQVASETTPEAGASTAAPSSEGGEAAPAGGASQITYGRQDDVVELDPVMMNSTNDIWTSTLMLETLVTTNDAGDDIIPGLAKDWTISEDGLVYTFNLTPDLKFSDGTPVTGEDWIWSFERARDTEGSEWTFTAENIEKIEAPDNNTLVITMKQNTASNLPNFSAFNMAVQSKAHFDATNSYGDAGSYPIGTGAYMVQEWQLTSHLLLVKNPNYRDAANVKTDEIKFMTIADDNSRVMMLQSGELDIIYPVPFSAIDQVKNTQGLMTIGVPSLANRYLVLNQGGNEAFAKKEVREALMYATDKQQLVDMVLYGYGEPAVSFMPKNGVYWNSDITPIPYDPAKAKELLAAAGYPDGFECEFLVRSGNAVFEQISTIIKQQWAEVGINVTLTSMETASLLELQYAYQHQIVIGSWSDDLPDPYQLAQYWFDYEVSHGFFTEYNNPTATEILKKAELELDDTKRGEYFKELQKIFYDDIVAINLYHSDYPVAMSEKISGYVQTSLGAYRFNNLAKSE